MRRRDFILTGLGGAAAAAVPAAAQTAPPPRIFQAQLVRMRFKPNGKGNWLDWAEQLKRRRAEVVETLRNEGVRAEACFLSKDGETLYYFIEAADLAKVTPAFLKSTLPIDLEHKVKVVASLEPVEEMTTLFSFQNDDFPNA